MRRTSRCDGPTRFGRFRAVEAKHDVLVVGAGCAGMRAAIEADDAGADVALISKIHPDAQPFRRGRRRDQRRARERLRGRSREARVRHRQGLGLPRRPGRDPDPLRRGAGRRLPARELGSGLLAHRGRPHRPAPVRRGRRAAHRLRGGHHGPRARARPLRAGDEARPQASTRSSSSGSSSTTTAAARA